MELIFNSLWIVGFVIAIFIIKFVIRKSQSIKAKQDLECYMANVNNVHHANAVAAVKALLLVRGHFLPKELRVDAQNWVEEMEEKLKGE